MQFLLLIFFIFKSSATEIHEEKYFCHSDNNGNRVDSNSRILILSPSKTYLSFEVLQNLTGKVLLEDGEKRFSYVLTLSGFLEGSCLTFIELPEVFENQDILEVTDHLKKRCFDKSLLFIDARFAKTQKEEVHLLTAQLQLLDLAYGPKFIKSLGVFILTRKKVTQRSILGSKKFVGAIFQRVIQDQNDFPQVPNLTRKCSQLTVVENQSKSLILQYCERSELR